MSERREKKYYAELANGEELFCFVITSHGKPKTIKMTVPEICVFLREQLHGKSKEKEAQKVFSKKLEAGV